MDSQQRTQTSKQKASLKHQTTKYLRRRQLLLDEVLHGILMCQKCGLTNDNYGFFDWHHKDSTLKFKGVNGMHGYKWERQKEEAEKCIFLCPNCHRKEHL